MYTDKEIMDAKLEAKQRLSELGKEVSQKMNDKIARGNYEHCYICPRIFETPPTYKDCLKPFFCGYVHHETVCNECVKNGNYKLREFH